MVNLRFSFLKFYLKLQYLKYSDSVVSENALPENAVLLYSKVFVHLNLSFQENAKTKAYAVEDSLATVSFLKYLLTLYN